ncbi:PorP/SprF family type IX secretion system membrane protein [Spongiimicrobium sp. 3-5]|uniref:PorP/SprF family type IX secretion system membrane protein n=1 Tax=Spongiimicrobium sp. 3-5 TaxID=3332596 RepID=UPI0039812C7D
MNRNITIATKVFSIVVLSLGLGGQISYSQETISEFGSNTAYHNQLFFNRFLINPTFSLVRENKSYLNILHRNQYATFEDNSQNYFLGFSNKLNDHTALGISVYSQWAGVIQEFGFNANYATSVQLSKKSKLTFGTNVTYFSEGLAKNRVIATENDPELLEASLENKLAIQPGITLSVGSFDFGLYAENLLNYNQTTNSFLTSFNDKSIKASLQYTYSFMTRTGLFSKARIMPLMQLGKNEDGSMDYVGSILLDLPEYGWLQTTLDDEYGLSLGFGLNLNKKLSLGYLLEKNVFEEEVDLGWNHELSLAYTFKNNGNGFGDSTEESNDRQIDRIVRNYEEQILKLVAEKDKSEKELKKTSLAQERKNKKERKQSTRALAGKTEKDAKKNGAGYNEVTFTGVDENSLAYQNRLILDELILRQDSVEEARNEAFEKKFETIVRILRNDVRRNIDSKPKNYRSSSNTVRVASNETSRTSNTSLSGQHKKYEKLPIKVGNLSDIIGVESGYYVIANVYKNKRYLNAFMKDLKEQGLNAKQFYNKKNGLHYVYLADFNVKSDAENAFVSNLDGKYRDEKWIMQVNNTNTATADITFEDQ